MDEVRAADLAATLAGRQDTSIAQLEAVSGKVARQAVVLIHGMGEQIPMDTIKSFAHTAWELDVGLAGPNFDDPNRTWSKPDERTGSLELRRITTRESIASHSFPDGVRTDFYELYWADLTSGSTWEQFTSWVRYLLWRPWNMVPTLLRGAWLTLWFIALLVIGLGAVGLVPEAVWKTYMPWWLPQKLLVPAIAALIALMHVAATKSFGRVVRYTRAEPDNIAARTAVRERGLALLRALHGDGLYARVVVVGHSLGTILAHDLISYFWAEQSLARTLEVDGPTFPAFAKVERAAAALDAKPSPETRADFRVAQAAFGETLRQASLAAPDKTQRWLITDLLTLGSPLAHAEVLLAKGKGDLHRRLESRELPSAPPYRELLDAPVLAAAQATKVLPIASDPEKTRLMAFPSDAAAKTWVLHYAAPFAAVRWTNIHDPASFVVRGDIISGPLRPVFGEGVEDIDLSKVDMPSSRFTHTRYWSEQQSVTRIKAFRDALNLLNEAS